MKIPIRIGVALSALGLLAGSVAVAAPGASAATDLSFQTPIHGGLLLNASNWGGEGSKAGTLLSGGVVNDAIDVWVPASASVASDFTIVPVSGLTTEQQTACTGGGATGCFLIEYTPGAESTGLCVSTVSDTLGAFARLRHCAAPVQDGAAVIGHGPVNQWQDFAETFGGDQLNQLQAVLEPTPFVLNVKAFGGKGAQVISWTSVSGFGAENQLWEHVTAAA